VDVAASDVQGGKIEKPFEVKKSSAESFQTPGPVLDVILSSESAVVNASVVTSRSNGSAVESPGTHSDLHLIIDEGKDKDARRASKAASSCVIA